MKLIPRHLLNLLQFQVLRCRHYYFTWKMAPPSDVNNVKNQAAFVSPHRYLLTIFFISIYILQRYFVFNYTSNNLEWKEPTITMKLFRPSFFAGSFFIPPSDFFSIQNVLLHFRKFSFLNLQNHFAAVEITFSSLIKTDWIIFPINFNPFFFVVLK